MIDIRNMVLWSIGLITNRYRIPAHQISVCPLLFKSSNFVRSRVNIQVYLIVPFVQQGFIDRFGRDPSRLQLLLLSDADKSC